MSYKKLRKKFTPEELADAFVFPVKLTAKQKKEEAELLAVMRKITRGEIPAEARFSIHACGLRMHIEEYLKQKTFDPDLTFGFFLKMYINDVIEKNNNEFSKEISIDEAMLNQLINDECTPPDYIAIRLELHSNNHIPAAYWLNLAAKQRLHETTNNKELREKEQPFVHYKLPVMKSE
jgi:plasmid maintenance system antidote protein VapI